MESRKQAIMAALDAWVRQRPGLEFGNYGDVTTYRAELRSIAKALHDYRELERAVLTADSITANMLLEAQSAYSGRLTIKETGKRDRRRVRGTKNSAFCVEYCTGQYWPTEYRSAACAVLASALWGYYRSTMPKAREPRLMRTHGSFTTMHDNIEGKTPGDWLRAKARQELGRGIAARWFS